MGTRTRIPQIRTDVGRWAMVPEWLLDAGVSLYALRVFSVLSAKYANHRSDSAFPSRRTLAEASKCSVDTVDKVLAELTSLGALSVRRRKRGKVNDVSVYVLHYAEPELAADSEWGSRQPAATTLVAAPQRLPSRQPAAQNQSHVTSDLNQSRARMATETAREWVRQRRDG